MANYCLVLIEINDFQWSSMYLSPLPWTALFLGDMVIVEIHHPFHYPATMVDHHPKGACQMVVCEIHARKTGVGNWNTQHQGRSLSLT